MKLFFPVGFIFVVLLAHAYAQETAIEGAKDCKLDLQLIVDGSTSVGEGHFNQMMEDIAEKFLDSLEIGPDKTRVGLFQYSHNTAEGMINEFDLDKFSDKESLKSATKAITYLTGTTFTGQAMKNALVHFTEKMRTDGKTIKVCIVFTDGDPSKTDIDITGVTNEWRKKGVHVFAVGIGGDIKPSGLVTIAGNKENAFEVPDWEKLDVFIETLKKKLCALKHDPTCAGPCPGAACCTDCMVKVQCICHDPLKPVFRFIVMVDDRSRGAFAGVYWVRFGPPNQQQINSACTSRTRDWPLLPPGAPVGCCSGLTRQKELIGNACGTTATIINPAGPYVDTTIRFSNTVNLREIGPNGYILEDLDVQVICDCKVKGELEADFSLLRKTRIEKEFNTTKLTLIAACGEETCCFDEKPEKPCCKKNIKECCLQETITIKADWLTPLNPLRAPPFNLVIYALHCWANSVASGAGVGVQLVEDGCTLPTFGLSGTPGQFSFQAFRFPGTLPPYRVYITCQMVVCASGQQCSTIPLGGCPPPRSLVGRRKRSVVTGNYLAMEEATVGPISITDAPNTSYAAKVVRPRRKFAGARRRLDQMMRKLGQSRG